MFLFAVWKKCCVKNSWNRCFTRWFYSSPSLRFNLDSPSPELQNPSPSYFWWVLGVSKFQTFEFLDPPGGGPTSPARANGTKRWSKAPSTLKVLPPEQRRDFSNEKAPRCQWSGQIIIFHQARCPWNKGISLTKPPFGVRSCEVAIISPEWSNFSHALQLF